MFSWAAGSERFWRTLGHSAWVFIRTASAIHVGTKYGYFFSVLTGPSMLPTLDGRGEWVLVDAFTNRPLEVLSIGDVVICVRPLNPAQNVIKRIMATAGETVIVYPSSTNPETRRVVVPKGHVWLQGDNICHSLDSREYGPVPVGLVKGRVILQVWPWPKMVT